MSNLAQIQLPILIYTLGQMAAQSDLALQGAMEFNEQKTRNAVDALRQLKSQLAEVTPDARSLVDSSAVMPEQRQDLADKLKRIDQADAFIPLWCRRYEGVQEKSFLYQSVEGCHNLIDGAIPLAWDWSTDLLFVHGELNAPMLQALQERGQKRVLVLDAIREAKTEDTWPSGMACIQKISEAGTYLEQLRPLSQRKLSWESPLLEQPLTQEEKDALEQSFSEQVNLAFTGLVTVKSLASQWLRQGLQNLPQMARSPSLARLKNAFKDKPLVIVSPGPSLDKNIDQLKALKGKAIILAAVQSAKALSDHGITADLMMVIDPKDFSYVLEGADINGVEALIAGVTCNERFVKQPFKQVIFCNTNNELDAWVTDIFGDTAIYGGGGSVSVSALRLALFTGANPIALVGQDLALTNGKVYSSNSVLGGVDVEVDEKTGSFVYKNCTDDFLKTGQEQGEDRQNGRSKMYKLPGYFGGEVNTRPDFFIFHHEFVSIAKEIQALDCGVELFNCTEGGAFIEGFEHLTLKNWGERIESGVDVSIKSLLAQSFADIDWEKRDKRLHARVQLLKTQLREANRLARECRAELQKSGPSKLDKLEKKLIKAVQEIPFISYLMQAHLNSQLIRTDALHSTESHNMVALSLYELIIHGCEDCLGSLAAAH